MVGISAGGICKPGNERLVRLDLLHTAVCVLLVVCYKYGVCVPNTYARLPYFVYYRRGIYPPCRLRKMFLRFYQTESVFLEFPRFVKRLQVSLASVAFSHTHIKNLLLIAFPASTEADLRLCDYASGGYAVTIVRTAAAHFARGVVKPRAVRVGRIRRT